MNVSKRKMTRKSKSTRKSRNIFSGMKRKNVEKVSEEKIPRPRSPQSPPPDILEVLNEEIKISIDDDNFDKVLGLYEQFNKIISQRIQFGIEFFYIERMYERLEYLEKYILRKAIIYNKFIFIKNFIEYKDKDENKSKTYKLIEYALDVEISNTMNPHTEIIDFLIHFLTLMHFVKPNEVLQSALMSAVLNNNIKIIEYLVSKGADIKGILNEAFMHAYRRGDLNIINYLVERGADVQARNNEALMQACIRGDLNIINYLVERGADVQARNNEALMHACIGCDLNIINYLVERGADVQARNNEALMHACRRGDLNIINYLVERGADVQASNNKALFESKPHVQAYLVSCLNVKQLTNLLKNHMGRMHPSLVELIKKNIKIKQIEFQHASKIEQQINFYSESEATRMGQLSRILSGFDKKSKASISSHLDEPDKKDEP